MLPRDHFGDETVQINRLTMRRGRTGELHQVHQDLMNALSLTNNDAQGFAAIGIIFTPQQVLTLS